MFSRVDSPMQTASLSERAPEIVLKRTLTNVGLGKRWDAKFVCPGVERAEVETTATPTFLLVCWQGRARTSIRERACQRPKMPLLENVAVTA